MESRTDNPCPVGLWPLTRYFLSLGLLGFGGAIAVAGYMQRDLVERRGWLRADEYTVALALAQVLPGPLTPQLAMALAYFRHGYAGALLAVAALVLPSFLVVLALAALYVANGSLWWLQAALGGVVPATIAVVAVAACRLARHTNGRDPLLWGLWAALLLVTLTAQVEFELAAGFILAGLLTVALRAPPRWLHRPRALVLAPWAPVLMLAVQPVAAPTADVTLQLLLVFGQAGIFGSGMGIVPLLHQGLVQQLGWLNEPQFLDAIALGMITPGPSATTAAFMGYLVAGLPGALVATTGLFGPVVVLTLVLLPWFSRHRDQPQVKEAALGAAAASTGAIAGATVILGQRAMVDLPAAAIALGSLAVLLRFKPPEAALLLVAGAIGVVLAALLGHA